MNCIILSRDVTQRLIDLSSKCILSLRNMSQSVIFKTNIFRDKLIPLTLLTSLYLEID